MRFLFELSGFLIEEPFENLSALFAINAITRTAEKIPLAPVLNGSADVQYVRKGLHDDGINIRIAVQRYMPSPRVPQHVEQTGAKT